MNALWTGLYYAMLMAWETFWALVLGFAISAAVQVFVSKDQMGKLFGHTSFRSVLLAMGFGAASSSCSYAAAAAARSAFTQGAALVPALAFMFASTNLVIELGAVLWLLMGWRFVAAEFVGSFVLVGLMWLLAKLFFPANLEPAARAHAEHQMDSSEEGCCHHHSSPEDDHTHDGPAQSFGASSRWRQMGTAFVMDWQMLWKEIAIGFLIAGYLSALVPSGWWTALFLANAPGWLRAVENAFVGPLIAVLSFVCSVGNLPLANLLWSDGISFGGVISFIYADLLIVPLVLIYGKYFGARQAAYITAALFFSTVGAGMIVDLLFTALGWVPAGPRPESAMMHMHFRWNYTTWLDLLALPVAGWLWFLHRANRSSVSAPVGMHHH